LKKCTLCGKPAVYHITELVGGEVREMHLCRQHFEAYMQAPDPLVSPAAESPSAQSPNPLMALLASALKSAVVPPSRARVACPHCGMTLAQFREKGRLGCPHDYELFAEHLGPLLENLHRAGEHTGKLPRNHATDTLRRAELHRLRQQLARAVSEERYEAAAELRDQIQAAESRGSQVKMSGQLQDD